MKLLKNDLVKVIAGDDKGHEGKVIKVVAGDNKVVIQGVNLHWKHLKRSKEYPHGARIQKELPIAAANVMLVCGSCSKPARVAYQI
ncbi:MAG: 50S ribosomal protein L24, partial [Planctomycetes bacterium]|nr:50S ribosomal protein L24 [Planctomycetota bacterium]